MIPPTVMKAVSINTRNLCRSAALTNRWIIQLWGPILARGLVLFLEHCSKFCAIRLALQRVRKLQEQAAISNDLVARLQSACNLGLSIQALPQRHRASSKLVRRCRDVNKRLVFVIAEDGSVRKRNGVGDHTSVYGRYHVHVFLQLRAGIVCLDAGL